MDSVPPFSYVENSRRVPPRIVPMETRLLLAEDASSWWDLRFEALSCEPLAFGMSVEEHRDTDVETIASHVSNPSPDRFTLGTFEDEILVGIATFARDTNLKERHKGHIYAVYVTPRKRRAGIGRLLLSMLLATATADESLEQILLAVSTCQQSAKALYTGFGFTTFGIEPKALKIGSRYVDEEQMILHVDRSR